MLNDKFVGSTAGGVPTNIISIKSARQMFFLTGKCNRGVPISLFRCNKAVTCYAYDNELFVIG